MLLEIPPSQCMKAPRAKSEGGTRATRFLFPYAKIYANIISKTLKLRILTDLQNCQPLFIKNSFIINFQAQQLLAQRRRRGDY
jgi:hypothetical protein